MSRARPVAVLALVALLLFVATALWTQVARSDLDWVRATLSLYLHGPWGWRCALPTACWRWPLRHSALRCIAAASAHGAVRPHRCCSRFPPWAATVAIGDSWLPEATPLLAPFIHGLAANTAFLCACVGMLLQAWYLRREPGWQPAADLLWGWAWLAFVLLWLHVLWRAGPPRGLGQKVVIAVIVGWLLYLATALYRRSRQAAAD